MGASDPEKLPPLGSVFTPGAPVSERSRFAGRAGRLERAQHVLAEPGRHLLVLGEAGVGRTSFAMVSAGDRPRRYHQTGLDDSFELLMERLLEPGTEASAGRKAWAQIDADASPAPVLIIDDIDRAAPEAIGAGITPLLRALADTRSETKLILTARRDRPFPDALAGAGLRLYAIGLERLDRDALTDIVTDGAKLAGVSFTPELRDRIVLDADGLPGMVHALCLEAARSARARAANRVTLGRDYLPALIRVVDSLAPILSELYESATESRGRSNRYAHLLWAGALCAGASFDLDELERLLERIESKPVTQQAYVRHLGDLMKRGLFARIREGLYRFSDPAMRVYIRLRLRQEEPGLMGEDPLQLALPY